MRAGVVEARRLRDATDVLQPVVAADGARFLADEFHAVVVRGVVAGGNHDTAVHLPGEGREVDDLGAAEPHVVHVDTRIEQTLLQRARQLLAREPDVAADDHPAGTDEVGVCAANPVGHVLVELGRNAAAQVIGLESGNGTTLHAALLSPRDLELRPARKRRTRRSASRSMPSGLPRSVHRAAVTAI